MIMQFKIAQGRTLSLDSFYLQATPIGSQAGEETIEDAIQRILPDIETFIIGRATPQPYLCVGTFHSDAIEDGDATCSVAAIAWFVSDTSASIRNMVQSGLATMDWEAVAQNSYV